MKRLNYPAPDGAAYPGPTSRAGGALGYPQSGKTYLWVGLALLVAYILQDILGWKWSWLVEMQRREEYKQLSGLVLVLVFAHQWRLALKRTQGGPSAAKALIAHRRWGAVAPLFFYLHAHEWGYAYTFALGLTAFAIFGTGLLQETVARLKHPRLTQTWLVGHVALSSALVFLVVYHLFISLWYE